jgi:geranylgeranyl reductase
MYDVIIVGAGPAGSTLARLLPKTYKILLVDKRKISGSAESTTSGKCCGGLLAPDAQAALSQMSLPLPKSVLVDPQIFAVKAIDLNSQNTTFYQRFYINMDRGRFDKWLLSLLSSNADVRLNIRFRSYQHNGKTIKVNLIEGDKIYSEDTKILVGADGAASTVRRQTYSKKPVPVQYISIQHLVESDCKLPYFCSIFDSQITDYYSWTIPKENNLLIGSALRPHDNPLAKFELLKAKLKTFNFYIGKTIRKQSALILRPTNINQIHTGRNGIALIGEASGWISPSSAEGLSFAFKSSLVLADILSNKLHDFEKDYFHKTMKMRFSILGKTIKSYIIYNPAMRNLIMKTGLNSLKVQTP